MSKYVRYYNKNQQVYRELAERWAKWAKSVQLTPDEIRGTSKFFYDIAVRFGLITKQLNHHHCFCRKRFKKWRESSIQGH